MMRAKIMTRAWIVPFVALLVLVQLSSGQAQAQRRSRQPRGCSARQAIRQKGIKAVAFKQTFLRRHNTKYSVKIRQPIPIRDQSYSGRCWLFAFTSVLQTKSRQRGAKPGELSASFLNYYALRDQAFGLLNEAKRSRKPPTLSRSQLADEGGEYAWAAHLVSKYGIVPESQMPTTADGADPGTALLKLQRLITAAFRDFRGIKGSGRRADSARNEITRSYKKKIERLLGTTIGRPPKKFKVNGRDYTPKTFMARKLRLRKKDFDFVILSHDPGAGWNRRYQLDGQPGMPSYDTYNVPMDVMQRAVKKTIRGGEAVWFAVNVDEANPFRAGTTPATPEKAKGILSIKAFDYAKHVPSTKLTKRDRSAAELSPDNHAMILVGYDTNGRGKGGVRKWKVQNSHGRDVGDKGFFHMYDDFFKGYVAEVVVPRSSVPKSLLARIDANDGIDATGAGMARQVQRWKPKQQQRLLLSLLRRELTVGQAAKTYGSRTASGKKKKSNTRKTKGTRRAHQQSR